VVLRESLQWSEVALKKLNVVAEEARRQMQPFVLRKWLRYIEREWKSAELSRAGCVCRSRESRESGKAFIERAAPTAFAMTQPAERFDAE
jgi:hypothetical protein